MGTSDLSTLYEYVKGGFAVQNATDTAGYIYAITWSQFDEYVKANKQVAEADWDLSGITPRQIYIASGDFAYTPLVKVFADDDDNYKSTITTVGVYRIM